MQWDESFTHGMAGGAVLIGVVFAGNCLALIARHAHAPAVLRMLLVHCIAAPIFILLGGVTAYYTAGRTGDFFQGIGWVALATLLAGGVIPGIGEERHNEMEPGNSP